MAITSNTANTTVTDRTASGNQPDNTPATGTTTSGSGGSGVSSVSSGSSNVTVTSTGGGGTGAVTISVSGGSGTGNVTGTGTTTVGHVAVFNNTSATGIQDGGPASLTIAGNAVSLGGSVSQDSITGLAPTTAGIVKHTSTANTLGIAVAADFPTLNQNTTGNAATVTGLSVTSGKTLTANNTLTLSGTDGSTLNIGTGGTLGSAAYTASSAYVAASSGTATNLTLAGTLKDSNSSSAGTSGQVLSSLGTGTKWVTPSSGGNVTGTSPTVSGNVAVFNNTTGTGIQDGGTLGTAAFTASTAYVSATATQTAHKFLAGPLTGTAAPTFRVIDPTDVPTLNQSTTGNAATATTATTATTAGNVTGIVAIANGGTGTSGPSLINGTGISVTGSWPNQTITNTTAALPSGGSTSKSLLYGTSTAGWYTEHFNVKAFGAIGDGSTDDHTAINTAIAALNSAGGGTLYFPYGTYKMTSAITTITVPCRVTGDGINASTINQTSTSDALIISTSNQCIVQDITLQCTSSYNALTITAPSGSFNSRSIVNNVNVGGTPAIGFNFNEAFAVVTNCTVTGTIGIKMQNLVNPDESAGMITQCQINTNGGTAIALYADGVQVIDNYFYDNNYAVEIFVNNTTGTLADFWITNNHIEYCLISAVRFNNTSSGSYLVNVLVSNNEIAWSPPPSVTTPATCNGVDQTGTLTSIQWLQDFTICDNVFSTNVNNVYLTHASVGTVVGNSMNVCNYGIYLGTDTSNILAKDNLIIGYATAAIDNGSSNFVGNDVGYTNVPSLTGGSATETKYLTVTQSVLGKKPDGVNVQVTSDPTVGCYYNWDDTGNSSTQVAIVFFKYSGGNLSSGPVRITARVGP